MFDYMMACAQAPDAVAAGFSEELACSFQALLDTLPQAERAAKVGGRAGGWGV